LTADPRRDLISEQAEATMEAEDVDRLVQELDTVTNLVRERSTVAVDSSAEVSLATRALALRAATAASRDARRRMEAHWKRPGTA
jgi:hypothetical protein